MGDGVESAGDVVVMLLLFYGLPLLVAAVPTALITWLVLRAWRRRRRGPHGEGSDAALAGWWFAGAALLPVLLFNLTIGMPAWITVLFAPWSPDSSVEWRYALFTVACSVAPVLAAFAGGCWLGAPILRPGSRARTAAGRGMLVALGAALTLALVMWIDVLSTDYSDAVETSPERSLALAQGVLAVLLLPALLGGALGGCALRRLAHPRAAPSGNQ